MTSLHGVAVQYPGCRQRRQLRQGRRQGCANVVAWPTAGHGSGGTRPRGHASRAAACHRPRSIPTDHHERPPRLRHIARSTAAVLDAHAATARTHLPQRTRRLQLHCGEPTLRGIAPGHQLTEGGRIGRMRRLAGAAGEELRPGPDGSPEQMRCRRCQHPSRPMSQTCRCPYPASPTAAIPLRVSGHRSGRMLPC